MNIYLALTSHDINLENLDKSVLNEASWAYSQTLEGENCSKNKAVCFRLMPLFAWHLLLKNINMNIVMAKQKKEDDDNKNDTQHSNIQNLLANKLELTLIKTANKNKNGFIIKFMYTLCATHLVDDSKL